MARLRAVANWSGVRVRADGKLAQICSPPCGPPCRGDGGGMSPPALPPAACGSRLAFEEAVGRLTSVLARKVQRPRHGVPVEGLRPSATETPTNAPAKRPAIATCVRGGGGPLDLGSSARVVVPPAVSQSRVSVQAQPRHRRTPPPSGPAAGQCLARDAGGGYNDRTTGTPECPCLSFTCTSIPNTRCSTA